MNQIERMEPSSHRGVELPRLSGSTRSSEATRSGGTRPGSTRHEAPARPTPAQFTPPSVRIPPPAPVPAVPPAARISATNQQPKPGRRHVPSGCLPVLLLAALVVGVLMWAIDSNDDHSVASAPDSNAAGTPFVPAPPIDLPPPFGTVSRVRPMQTVLLIDPIVPGSFANRAAFVDEIQAATGYMESYSIIGDGIAVGDSEVHRFSTAGQAIGGLVSNPPVAHGDREAWMRSTADQLAAFPDDDRLVLVITPEPAAWTRLASPSPARDLSLPPVDRQPTDRTFVIDVSAGSSASGLSEPPHASPSTLPASPTTRGSLAEAIAQAWVAGYDGSWPAN